MKNTILITLFIIPFTLSAQSNDYCPCQDDLKNQAEIFNFVSSVNTDLYVKIQQNTVNTYIPSVVQEEAVISIVLPKEKPVEVEEETTELDDEFDKIDREERIAEIRARNEERAATFKKIKKRPKFKIKRQKRTKKYRGKCPLF